MSEIADLIRNLPRCHPAAALFPLMGEAELRELAADIRERGQRDPIIMIADTDGLLLLDGRNRWLACRLAGATPKTKPWTGKESPTAYVLSKNLRRRHLSAEQRAALAVELLPIFEQEAKGRMAAGGKGGVETTPPSPRGKRNEGGRAIARAATAAGASPDTAKRLKAATDKAPEILPLARDGEINVAQAQAIAEAPEEKRAEVIEGARAGKPARELRRRFTRPIFPDDPASQALLASAAKEPDILTPLPAAALAAQPALTGSAIGAALAEGRRQALGQRSGPAAETIVEDRAHGTEPRPPEQRDRGALPPVREDAASDVLGAEEGGRRSLPSREGQPSVAGGVRETGAAGDAAPRLPAAEPYDVAERIDCLRKSPLLRDVPPEQRPVLAVALRGWAEGLDPEPDPLGTIVGRLNLPDCDPISDLCLVEQIVGEVERLRARVRELDLEYRRLCGAMRDRLAGEVEQHRSYVASDAERADAAGRRGYETGAREALVWVAGLLPGVPYGLRVTTADLRELIEATINSLRGQRDAAPQPLQAEEQAPLAVPQAEDGPPQGATWHPGDPVSAGGRPGIVLGPDPAGMVRVWILAKPGKRPKKGADDRGPQILSFPSDALLSREDGGSRLDGLRYLVAQTGLGTADKKRLGPMISALEREGT